VRARLLLPQFAVPRLASIEQLGWGLCLLILGLSSKVVLADSLFAPVVDAVYAHAAQASALEAWLAVFAFSAQIYCDFNGYTLCAIGVALCFGFSFPDNFRYPYAASGFGDFWHRWHISLSSWLRDYLYIPLGGSRHGQWRTSFNLLATMLLGGLWHGASWMFVLWGGLHGLYLVVERALQHGGRRLAGGVYPALVFLLVSLTWIPFRAPDLPTMGQVAAALLRVSPAALLEPLQAVLCAAGVILLLAWHRHQRDRSLEQAFARAGLTGQWAAIAAGLAGMFLLAGGDAHSFIYFQF
jgi:D-alanyl-lipoteichoic acid acyltransferase DltB (MBOAT superfamily)